MRSSPPCVGPSQSRLAASELVLLTFAAAHVLWLLGISGLDAPALERVHAGIAAVAVAVAVAGSSVGSDNALLVVTVVCRCRILCFPFGFLGENFCDDILEFLGEASCQWRKAPTTTTK